MRSGSTGYGANGGCAVGPLVFGLVAELAGINAAFWIAAGLLAASGLVLLVLLRGTDPRRRSQPPDWEKLPEPRPDAR
jgi:MFS family permease